jgi:predicted DNA-binding protein (MmcQ/YjbR family)
MARPKPDAQKVAVAVREFALAMPGAWQDTPWEEDHVAKVGKKIFVFMGDASNPTPGITVKLPESQGQALGLDCVVPSGYGLGRAGWVTIDLAGRDRPSLEVLCDWVEESYRAIAPKKLIKELDAAHED